MGSAVGCGESPKQAISLVPVYSFFMSALPLPQVTLRCVARENRSVTWLAVSTNVSSESGCIQAGLKNVSLWMMGRRALQSERHKQRVGWPSAPGLGSIGSRVAGEA